MATDAQDYEDPEMFLKESFHSAYHSNFRRAWLLQLSGLRLERRQDQPQLPHHCVAEALGTKQGTGRLCNMSLLLMTKMCFGLFSFLRERNRKVLLVPITGLVTQVIRPQWFLVEQAPATLCSAERNHGGVLRVPCGEVNDRSG